MYLKRLKKITNQFALLLLVISLFSCSKEQEKEVIQLSPYEQAVSNLLHSDKFVREKAAEELANLGDKKAVPELIASLDDREGRVRAAAARALGALGDEKALDRLLELGRDDEDLEVRKNVALAIAEINKGGEEIIDLLLEFLKDPNPAVRVQAADTFAALGELSKPAVPRLIRSLDDTNETVRSAAESALVKIGSAAIEDLAVALKEGRFYTRDSAAQILTKIGTPEALDALRVAKEERKDS